jgi:hypothetical protein
VLQSDSLKSYPSLNCLNTATWRAVGVASRPRPVMVWRPQILNGIELNFPMAGDPEESNESDCRQFERHDLLLSLVQISLLNPVPKGDPFGTREQQPAYYFTTITESGCVCRHRK